MTQLYIFNPENDLALANGCRNYYPPPAARQIARDLALLPLWYSADNAVVVVPECPDAAFVEKAAERFGIRHRIAVRSKFRGAPYVTECVPWGWSPYVVKRFTDMGISSAILPSQERISWYRELSNRKSAIRILQSLKRKGLDVPEPLPDYAGSVEDAMRFVETFPRSVLKAPWSGSGHGLVWGRGMRERSVEQLCRGIINRQGGIVCERALDKVADFAMEFDAGKDGVEFAGYSLFRTDEKGVYQGNLLADDTCIENLLCRYIRKEYLFSLRQAMAEVSGGILGGNYRGVFGVDMMIYDDAGVYRINPCVELNLRMSMGALARVFYDRYVAEGVAGRLDILYFDKPGEAVWYVENAAAEYPATIEGRRLVSGVLPLVPVAEDTGYVALARCGTAVSELQEFSV